MKTMGNLFHLRGGGARAELQGIEQTWLTDPSITTDGSVTMFTEERGHCGWPRVANFIMEADAVEAEKLRVRGGILARSRVFINLALMSDHVNVCLPSK